MRAEGRNQIANSTVGGRKQIADLRTEGRNQIANLKGKSRVMRMEGRTERKDGKTDYSKYSFSVKEWVRYGLTGLGIGAVMVWLTYDNIKAFPLAVAAAVVYLVLTHRRLLTERQKILQYHFRDFLSSLHTTLAAGYSMENAVRSATSDIEKLFGKKDILTNELKNIVWQMSCQIPVEQAFRDLGERSCVEDIAGFGEVLIIAKRTGGSMDKVLEATWRNLCEKIDTSMEIDAMIASKRYEQSIMSLMPAGIILYLKVGFQGFLDPMYHSTTGILIMTGCLALYLFAFFLGRKMTASMDV
ncbi:MAG: type II secretion system F family protein [Eubacterium sp.]|nr:type II secretion system F family protein [Eubacterium sp.]